MRKALAGLACLIVASGGGVGIASALEYKAQVGVAAYLWEERFDNGTPQESGPALTLGAYVRGFPSTSHPALTLRGDAQLFVAHVDYDTFAQDLSSPGVLTPVNTDSKYFGVGYEGRVGSRAVLTRSAIEPFIGMGYRWWRREIESTNTVGGYPELYHTLYGRLGVRGERRLTGTTLHGTASLDPMLWAQEQIDQSDFLAGKQFTVHNGKRLGWTLEVGLSGPTMEGVLYWRATRFGESNHVSCFEGLMPGVNFECFQPESKQDVIGVNIGLVF